MQRRTETEWPWTLDVGALMARGWRPVPFNEFVVKIHSRPGLSSDYFYTYEMVDQSWRSRPHRMSHEVAEQTAARIGEHARAHGLQDVVLILHGGEPLVAGREIITYLLNATRDAAGPGVAVNARIQTNAIGLDNAYLELLDELDFRIGVSLDRDTQNNDIHRRFLNGRGGDVAALAGLNRLVQPRFRHLFSGLLCTIDLEKDPIATYDKMISYNPPSIDFLLPYGTWEAPPPGRTPGSNDSPYADWLITVFDYWYHAPGTSVRLFEDIIRLLLGANSRSELLSLLPAGVVVIETDGAIAQADTLASAQHAALATGLNVGTDPIDSALFHPGSVARQLGAEALCAKCRVCPILRVCGGGLYSHRYQSGTGFANPSVYCPDLMRLINHIRQALQDDIQSR